MALHAKGGLWALDRLWRLLQNTVIHLYLWANKCGSNDNLFVFVYNQPCITNISIYMEFGTIY